MYNRYVALASDYDGTLAKDGRVLDQTLEALQRFRQSGRRLILVTGRELKDLESVFSRLDLFDSIVAENGAVLYTPSTREKRILAPVPKPLFLETLHQRGIPIGVGDAIVSTWHPNEAAVLEIIHDLGLELQVIFNKGAVMVLPSGVNKRSGLQAALDRLCISEHNVVGVGDAENDHAFLEFCECGVAVANALPAVKDTADLVTAMDHGSGVTELIEMVLKNDLSDYSPSRRSIPVGYDGQTNVCVSAYGSSLLVSGASGSGKSTFVAGWLEILIERQYQVCLIDPEGDYEAFPNTIAVGDEKHAPATDEVLQILQKPSSQVIVNLIGIPVAERPEFFGRLLPRLQEMRMRLGRPHWIMIDEAHHMLAPEAGPASVQQTGELNNLVLITVHPEHIAPAALKNIDAVFAVGPAPGKVMEDFAKILGITSPKSDSSELAPGKILTWLPKNNVLRTLNIHFADAERKRHKRNYAYGELSKDQSFYFRGPEQKLNLRAHNLTTFVQLAEGVDDETWRYHLARGDYSRWFRERIKDEALADEVAEYERQERRVPDESRERVKAAIERRYTSPA
jgi:hypothetical protein